MSSSSCGCHASPSQSTLRSAGSRIPSARARANHSRSTLGVPPMAVTSRSAKKPSQSTYSSWVTEPTLITRHPERSAKAAARKCAPHIRPAPQALTKTSSRVQRLPLRVDAGHVEAGGGVADLGRAGAAAALEQPGGAGLGLGLQGGQGDVEVVLVHHRQRRDVVEVRDGVVAVVPAGERRHGREPLEVALGHVQGRAGCVVGQGEVGGAHGRASRNRAWALR